MEVRVTETDKALSKAIAEIGVNATNIELKVSKGGSIADINASVASGQSEVKISADAISLEGAVTANENFVIDETGKMHCKDAEIVGGTIKIETSNEQQNSIILNTKLFGTETKNSISSYGLRCQLDTQTGYMTAGELNNNEFILANRTDENNYYGLYASVDAINSENINSAKFMVLNGKVNGTYKQFFELSANGDLQTNSVKTNAGADLDTVKAKVDGSLKSTYVGHATGTSSAFPSVNISSIPNDTMMRIEVGIPIDNATSQTIAWFSTTVKKSTSTTDYLYNCGGYYYSANYNASIFISVSNSRVTINNAWTKVIGGSNAAAVNNLKSKSSIYVYTENL